MKKEHQPTTRQFLEAAYLQTDYSFTCDGETIIIRPGDENRELMAFLEREKIAGWAYLTAWNPHSVLMPEPYNEEQQALLLKKLDGYRVYKGAGKGRIGDWPAEESFFVVGISRERVCRLGRSFGQNAILLSGKKGEPLLELLFPGENKKTGL